MHVLASALAVAAFAAALPAGARAGGVEIDPQAGRGIADRLCSRCHAVGLTGDSRLAAAPAFRTLGRDWPVDNLAEALAEGIVTGHKEMPQFELTPRQIDELLAWLRLIQRN
jgi:cytochrome c